MAVRCRIVVLTFFFPPVKKMVPRLHLLDDGQRGELRSWSPLDISHGGGAPTFSLRVVGRFMRHLERLYVLCFFFCQGHPFF